MASPLPCLAGVCLPDERGGSGLCGTPPVEASHGDGPVFLEPHETLPRRVRGGYACRGVHTMGTFSVQPREVRWDCPTHEEAEKRL
jgi:hypothetical protein